MGIIQDIASELVKRRLLSYLQGLTPARALAMIRAGSYPWDTLLPSERTQLLQQLRSHKAQVMPLNLATIMLALGRTRPDLWSIVQNTPGGREWLQKALDTLKTLAS